MKEILKKYSKVSTSGKLPFYTEIEFAGCVLFVGRKN